MGTTHGVISGGKWRTLDTIALLLYVLNLGMGIMLADFAGGFIAGGMACMLIFRVVTKLTDRMGERPKAT